MKDNDRRPIKASCGYWTITRRDFLKAGSGFLLAGLSSGTSFARADNTDSKARLSFGIVTDAHYADAEPGGARRYRDSLAKMTECVTLMNDKKVAFLIELGDFKDQGKPPTEESSLEFLGAIEKVYGQFRGPRYHVLGNHDADSISKTQFLEGAGEENNAYAIVDVHDDNSIVVTGYRKALTKEMRCYRKIGG